MTDTMWIVWGVPAVALLLGGLNIAVVWLSSRDFDRRYGRMPK